MTNTDIKVPEIWQYVVIWDPTEKQHEEGDRSKVIVQPSMCLAMDQGGAFLQAGQAIPEEYRDQIDQVRVVVRPF